MSFIILEGGSRSFVLPRQLQEHQRLLEEKEPWVFLAVYWEILGNFFGPTNFNEIDLMYNSGLPLHILTVNPVSNNLRIMFWGVDLGSFFLLQFLHSHCKELELQKQAKQMLEEIRFFAVIGQSLGQFSLSKIGGGWFEHAKPFQDMVKSRRVLN